MRKTIVFFLIFLLSFSVFGQSRRIKQTSSETSSETKDNSENSVSAEKLYAEAFNYLKKKFEEYEAKKIGFGDTLRNITLQEQRQLAAKYATQLTARKNLVDDDFYYLGMLHWLAENKEGAVEFLTKFLALEKPNAEKQQTSRAVVAVASAQTKEFEKAEKFLAEYLKNEPKKLSEIAKMASELAQNYQKNDDLMKASGHAEEAYKAYKSLFKEQNSRARAIQDVVDSGLLVFDVHSQKKDSEKAGKTLEDLQDFGVKNGSIEVYFEALNQRINFLVERKLKKDAIGLYSTAVKSLEQNFPEKQSQARLKQQLRKKERHYLMLGESAPDLIIDRWLETPRNLSQLRGKVVLLDFWATWCGPCIETFPTLIEMHNSYQKEGLEIIGVTRYYGEAEGMSVDPDSEVQFIRKFKKMYKLPYDLVVAKNTVNHKTYGAEGLPTAVLIDRQGTIRYIHTGSGKTEELEKVVEKILAEK